jgi:hypothetical protein
VTLLEFTRRADGVAVHMSLEELWHRAEEIGRPEVKCGWGEPRTYEVNIKFENDAGSTIWAKGQAMHMPTALWKAIEQAEKLRQID